MKIQEAAFAGAIGTPGQAPPGRLPQVALSGRSNVGKSSLINRLLGRTRRRIARISATPGKTQEINFYRVRATLPAGATTEFYLVDLPGYGYARVPAELRRRWKPLIEGYLSGTPELRGVVQVLDARHGATALDLQMVEMLAELGLPTLFVLTKIDKLGRAERKRSIDATTARLGVGAEQVAVFSAETGEGRELLLESLAALLFESKPGGRT